MKPRNDQLHAEIDRIADAKLIVGHYKTVADKHHVSVEYVRQLVSAAVRRKRTNVTIHVELRE